MAAAYGVASRAEAWVETSSAAQIPQKHPSPPVRRRGLKPSSMPNLSRPSVACLKFGYFTSLDETHSSSLGAPPSWRPKAGWKPALPAKSGVLGGRTLLTHYTSAPSRQRPFHWLRARLLQADREAPCLAAPTQYGNPRGKRLRSPGKGLSPSGRGHSSTGQGLSRGGKRSGRTYQGLPCGGKGLPCRGKRSGRTYQGLPRWGKRFRSLYQGLPRRGKRLGSLYQGLPCRGKRFRSLYQGLPGGGK